MTDTTIVEPKDVPEDAYEEWVAHPDRRQFVRARDHALMGSQQGWWALPCLVTLERARQLGYKPRKRRG